MRSCMESRQAWQASGALCPLRLAGPTKWLRCLARRQALLTRKGGSAETTGDTPVEQGKDHVNHGA
jgi:hypothetical protein